MTTEFYEDLSIGDTREFGSYTVEKKIGRAHV